MRTREHELHKPYIKVEKNKDDHYYCISVICSACNKILNGEGFIFREILERQKECLYKEVTKNGKSYCPHCGARIKELEQ